jgi:hypothetical protein
VGGFSDHVIISEGAYIAMLLLLGDWRIAYRARCADTRAPRRV